MIVARCLPLLPPSLHRNPTVDIFSRRRMKTGVHVHAVDLRKGRRACNIPGKAVERKVMLYHLAEISVGRLEVVCEVIRAASVGPVANAATRRQLQG